jgi:hypothetical protein
VTGDCNNGEGTYLYSNAKYWGNWKDGKREGKGIMYFNDGSTMYQGNYSNDKRNGLGILYWSDGNRYEGNWIDDNRTGQGTFYWKDGDKYVGQFLNGQKTENGVTTTKAIQRGCISGDCNNGYGKWNLENAVYEGYFKNGKREGKGKMVFWDNSTYVGDYANGLKNGKGKYEYVDGSVYDGDWVDNIKTGQGIYVWGKGTDEGNRYEGSWVNNNKTGYGIHTYKKGKDEGDRYEGDWFDDKRTGFGKLTKKDGTIQEGKWINDVFQGAELASSNTQVNTQEKNCDQAKKKYLDQNPDVAKNGMDAWVHYTSYGKKEGRKWPNCSDESNSTTTNTPATDRYYNATSTSNVSANKTESNYTFTKAPELKINYLDNRKMCCCCDQTYSQYKLRENIVTEEKIYYLTEKLADFHQKNGNALLSKTKNETQIQNDLSNLKSFLNTTYPGNQMFISFSVDFWYNSFMSGMMIFNQGQNKTKPGSTERFVDKYEIISPFCSVRCKNDVRCKSCH